MSGPRTLLTILDRQITAAATAGRGVMATVTASNGYLVQVQVGSETTDRGQWYPATATGLLAGTVGVLTPLTGPNALFHALGQQAAPIIPAASYRDGSSVGTYTDSAGTGVVINSLQVTASGLDATRTYLAWALVAMRLGASTGTPLQQAGIRMGSDGGATTTKGTGHSAGVNYDWAFGSAQRTFTGLTSFQVNGVAYANVTTAQNIAGGELDVIIWPM